MFPTRILIIEDNQDNLDLMRLLLERAKYKVFTATDGATGLNIANKEQPEVILLDLAMPEMDGWEVARKLKNNILTKSIPIIAVTAHSFPKDRERALEAGCEAIIGKPFSVAKLIGEIEKLTDW
jgi:CheY-like chemotaxis protein